MGRPVTAAALVREARAAGAELRLVDGAVKVRGNPSPDLLARLRAAKPEITALLKGVPTPPLWDDDWHWCRCLGAAGIKPARLIVLAEWLRAAGCWASTDTAFIRADLRRGLARATLETHCRMLGLTVEVVDDPHVERILAAGRRAANPDLAADPGEAMLRGEIE